MSSHSSSGRECCNRHETDGPPRGRIRPEACSAEGKALVVIEYGALIERYGYLATLAGTLVEGESLLILSGLAAHRGYLSLPLVVVVGAVGGAIGDIVFFLLGRHYGNDLLRRFPRFAPAADRVHGMIERHP